MPPNDPPACRLLQDAIAELGSPFTLAEVRKWFESRYPRVTERTIRQELHRMSVNAIRRHRTSLPKDLFEIDRSTYRRYDPERDGVYDELGHAIGHDDEGEPEDLEEPTEEALEFALEAHLEEFMEANWPRIDFGHPLVIWSGENGQTGRQYSTDIGIIDFLCTDTSNGELVVVELKRGRSSDRVVGQCLRYMGWVRRHLANGRPVRGIIIAREHDEQLKYAVAEVPIITFMSYKVEFQLVREAAND